MTNLTKFLSVVVAIALMVTVLIPCFTVSAAATTYTLADFEGKYKPLGRTVIKDGNLVFAQSASGIAFKVNGSGDLQFTLKLISRRTGDADGVAGGYFTVVVDGVKLNADKRYPADRGSSWTTNSSNYPYVIVTKDEEKTFTIPNLSNGEHTIEIIGQNEPDIATLAFKSITFAGTIADEPANRDIYIEAIGDSISTGFGLLANSGSMHGYASLYQDATLAWPYLLATSLNADLSVVGRAGIAATPGTGYTGDMLSYYPKVSTQVDGSATYDFARKADVVVVCLGTNDLSVTNGKTQDQLKEGIKNMLKLARQKNPNAHIVLIYNMMKSGYDSLFSAAASELGGAASRYYSLKLTTNNAAAGSHPNLSAHASYAADLKALIDTFTFEPMPENAPADYSEVDKAIAAANALTPSNYVDFSAVTNAIAAVVRGKTVAEQETVNAYAKAINDAVKALKPIANDTVTTLPSAISSNITTGTNDVGDTKYTAAAGAKNTYIAFNQQISADKTYYVSFDFKGGNTAGTGANDYAWSLGLVTDPAATITAPVKASVVPLNIAANIADWRTFGAVVKGSDFANISATVKYLAVVSNNVTAAGEFANFLIKEVDPNYIYPSAMTIKDNYGNMQSGVVVEDSGLAFGITTDCKSWSLDNYFIFDTEIEAGKYYILSFDYKGHNHDAPVNYGAYTAYDGSAFSGSKISASVPSTRSNYTNITRIIKGDDLLVSNRKYFGFVLQSFNTATDQATTLIKNVSLKEVTVPEGCLAPVGFANNAGIVELENNEFAFGINQSEKWEDGYLLFDYELKPDRKYKLSFDTRVHSYQTPISIGSTYSPKSTAGFSDSRKIVIEEPSSAGKYTHMELEFNGSSLYGVVGENTAKYFAFKLYSYGGAGNPANVLVKNVKIIDISPADYTAVDNAIANANGLNKDNYVDFSGVTSAINAVIRNKLSSEQAAVDAMADAINNAISALVLKDADYTAVDEAFAKVVGLSRLYYKDLTAVDAAAEAIVRGKNITEQAEVDAMAKAIEDALAALEYKDADYSEVEAATNSAVALRPDADLYTNFRAVEDAVANVELGKNITEQALVDAMAKAINDAIAALEYKDADYSKVEAAIDAAEALDKNDYTNFEAVENAINAVEYGKKINEQAAVDAYAKAIEDAINGLIDRADYTEIDELLEDIADIDLDDYTKKSVEALSQIMLKLDGKYFLAATEQDEVDAIAKELADAFAALIRKPVNDGGNSSQGGSSTGGSGSSENNSSVGNNNTDKTPDKTGDSSNIFVVVATLIASVLGLAVLVITKKKA